MKTSATSAVPLRVVASPTDIPLNESDFYANLVTRNRHFISDVVQDRLKNLKVLIAGCGSAGGACVEPLVRLGVTHLRLADNGSYELSNLNRQHAFIDSIGTNKATFHRQQALRINPFVDIIDFPRGISRENCREMVRWADVVLDCVDVTTPEAIEMKFFLHECAKLEAKPTLCPLDVGFAQWGMTFDYRKPQVAALDGRLVACRRAKHPIKALFTMFPLHSVPNHSLPLVYEVLTQERVSASQLGCASDVLSGIVAAALVRWVSSGELIKGWNINLETYALTRMERWKFFWQGFALRYKIRRLMSLLK